MPTRRSSCPRDWPKQGNLLALLPGSDQASSRSCCWRISTWSRQPRRLGTRSLQAGRRRRILLRARFRGRQGHGRGVCRHDGALQARGLPAEARHQAGADLRRRDAECVQRREVPHREPPRTSSMASSRSTKAAAAATTSRPACIDTSPCSRRKSSTRTSRCRRTNPGGHSSRPMPDNAIYQLGACAGEDRGVQLPDRVQRCLARATSRSSALSRAARKAPT